MTGRATEDSVIGGLTILAFAIGGAVLLGIIGFVGMGFVAEWLWGPFVGKAKVAKAIYAGWGGAGGFILGLAAGVLVAFQYLSRTKDH